MSSRLLPFWSRSIVVLVVGLGVLRAAPVQRGDTWSFENQTLRVEVSGQRGDWQVLDKRSGRVWRQATESAQERWVVPVRRVGTSPKLDGALDEWSGDGVFVGSKLAVASKSSPTKIDGDRDCSARFHLAWNDEGLWLAADVTDDKLAPVADGADPWHMDSVELWLGHEHWGFVPDGEKVQVACWSSPAMGTDCRAAYRPTATGWQLEALVPWSRIATLAKGGKAGAEVLLALGVNDCDGGAKRQCQLFYPAGYEHKVFATHAMAVLSSEAQAGAPKSRVHMPTSVKVRQMNALPAPTEGVEMRLDYTQPKGGVVVPLTVRLSVAAGDGADLSFELSGDPNTAFDEVALPAPFVLDEPEAKLVIPQNAGLLFGVEEVSWHNKNLGGFMSMPWFGATDLASGQGYVCIFDTPDDVVYKGWKASGRDREVLTARASFEPQKKRLGYARRLLFHFADRGSYVALAKRYRAHVQERGTLRTLTEKRRTRPVIDKLVGAVNVYCGKMGNIQDLRRLGVERLMVSGFSGKHVEQINAMGYLSSHYDIYTDLYEPDRPAAKWERCEGFSFPADVVKKADQSDQVGWCPIVDPKTGKKYPSYVICWQRGLEVLREKMPRKLAASPYNAYFLDCVTATRPYECYDPAHPLNRTTDRETRIEQLRYLTEELGLVAGSEQGRGWAVQVADYFEGVMSTSAFFANPKEIHGIPFPTLDPSPAFARYEEYAINPARRVPLFQLVYGDCCETTWRWGDNSHRMPYLWAQKDLLAIVHAAMPTWVLWDVQQGLFLANMERFKECYENVCRWRRAVGYHEMTNHERLAKDGMVQRSSFANGAKVTVNFAADERVVDGVKLPPRSYLITGDAPELAGLPVGRPVRVSDPWEPKELVVTGNTGFEAAPIFWRGASGMDFEVQDEVAHGGKSAARLSGTQDSNGWSYALAPQVPLQAGKKYRLRCWLRVDQVVPARAPKLKCEIHKDGHYLVNMFTPAYDVKKLGTWQRLETVFTVPAGADSGRLALEKGGKEAVAATLYLDDVELVPVDGEGK